jgi:hypothetical protein
MRRLGLAVTFLSDVGLVLAFLSAVGLVLAVLGSSGRTTTAAETCSRGAVTAVIAGKGVCFRAGGKCARRYDAKYKRYGFQCHNGRLSRRAVYLKLAGNQVVRKRTVLLRAGIVLARQDTVFFQSDGTYKPKGKSAANIYVAVDGRKASNDSLVDWRTSARPTAHPFDAVGGLRLQAGRHAVELVAEPPSWLPRCVKDDCRPSGRPASGRSFTVAAGANLSVLVHPATSVKSQVLGADAGTFDFKTAGLLRPDNTLTGPLPFVSLLSAGVPPRARAVAFGSGWVYAAGIGSDAMLTSLVDGRFPGNAVASWTNQDLWYGAEPRGSLSSQAFLAPTARARKLSLATVEFPWAPTWGNGGENPTVYSVAAGTGLTVLSGGMPVAGSATEDFGDSPNSSIINAGSSTGSPGSPPVGTAVELASVSVAVPHGDSGVVLFSAKSGTHGGDFTDTGFTSNGTISLWLTIDGRRAGPRVFQQVASPSSGSRRPIAVSYLAAGSRALKPGRHRVRVWGRTDGSFFHAYMWRDLPLVWFD